VDHAVWEQTAVRGRVPEGYRAIMAHHCGYAGRRYVHLTLARDGRLVSLVIARKQPGESLAGLGESARPAGVPVYQASAQRYEVAAFETGDFLAFVVSDLKSGLNLQIATAIAPAVHDFLLHAGV